MNIPGNIRLTALVLALATAFIAHGAFAEDAPPGFSNRTSTPAAGPVMPPAPASSQAVKREAPADVKPMTLEECVSYALSTHPKIKGAEQDVHASEFRTREAISAFWPQIAFEASRNYVHSARQVRIGGTSLTTTADFVANNMTFNTNWTLFDFGQTYFAVKSLSATEGSFMKTLTGAQQKVAYDIMDAYYALLKAQRLVAVSEETLKDANGHLKQAQAFFDVGVKPRFDVTQAIVEVNNAEVSLIQSKDAVRTARANLNTRIGMDPMTPLTVEDRPELEKLDKPMDTYLEEAVKNRPDVQTLEETLRSNEYSVKGAFAAYLPTVSASAAQNWYKEDHTDILDNENLQFTVDMPIFDGFLRCSKLGETRATVLSTKYKIEDLKKDVQQSVSLAYIAVEDAKARFTALETSVKAARENLDIAQGRYEAGVGALIDVTDAQVSLTTAETALATAFYDYHTAYTALMRSVGASVEASNTAKK